MIMIKDLALPTCIELLQNNYIGRLAYIAHQCPYVIPITYYYNGNAEDYIISYSLEGHKIEAMRENSTVSIQVDRIESVDRWKSVLVQGTFEELSGIDAKNMLRKFSQGVKDIVNRQKDKDVQFIHEFSSKLNVKNGSPIVYRIKVQEITGKERL